MWFNIQCFNGRGSAHLLYLYLPSLKPIRFYHLISTLIYLYLTNLEASLPSSTLNYPHTIIYITNIMHIYTHNQTANKGSNNGFVKPQTTKPHLIRIGGDGVAARVGVFAVCSHRHPSHLKSL